MASDILHYLDSTYLQSFISVCSSAWTLDFTYLDF